MFQCSTKKLSEILNTKQTTSFVTNTNWNQSFICQNPVHIDKQTNYFGKKQHESDIVIAVPAFAPKIS